MSDRMPARQRARELWLKMKGGEVPYERGIDLLLRFERDEGVELKDIGADASELELMRRDHFKAVALMYLGIAREARFLPPRLVLSALEYFRVYLRRSGYGLSEAGTDAAEIALLGWEAPAPDLRDNIGGPKKRKHRKSGGNPMKRKDNPFVMALS